MFRWKNLKPVPFIIWTTVAVLIFTIPIAIFFEIFEISDQEIGGMDFEKYNNLFIITIAVVLAPLIETFIGQVIPIRLSQKFFKRSMVPILISILIFSALHYGYSIWYSILTLPMAYALAQTYVLFQHRRGSAFWMTVFVHAFRNLIALPFIL